MRRLKQEALSTRISTSDTGMREKVDTALTDAYERRFDREVERAVLGDAIANGMGATLDGQHVPIEQVKVSSPGLASLAAKYVSMTETELAQLMDLSFESATETAADIRSLAASVLAQAEGKRK